MRGVIWRALVVCLLVALWPAGEAMAQGGASGSRRATAAWTVAGAAGGFGIGVAIGLRAFDDSVNSDRKVWTSAIAGASVGGVVAWLIARRHHSRGDAPVTRAAAGDWCGVWRGGQCLAAGAAGGTSAPAVPSATWPLRRQAPVDR